MTRVVAVQGDITTIKVDAIVNAANARMVPGGGVDGAINKAAGPKLGKAMRKIGPVRTGQSRSTAAFDLPARYVIHAVGPIYADYKPSEAAHHLANAYESALIEANELKCKVVSAPLISTGVYGYPMEEAIAIAVDECTLFEGESVEEIKLVAFDATTFKLLKKVVDDAQD